MAQGLQITNRMIRIAITGPESTGKTTLSNFLAAHYSAQLCPEIARAYLEKTQGRYTSEDLDKMAQLQYESWVVSEPSNMQVSDTEMTVFKIWSQVKYKTVSSLITTLLQEQTFDIYLLCKPDLPWEEDPLREHPEMREELFEMYLNELHSNGHPYHVIEGQNAERNQRAIQAIDELIRKKV